MTITVQQIAQCQEILGSYVQHLAKNPRDFLALVKLDIELAQRYAQAFSAGHALTLLSNAQAQGIRLATEILTLDPRAFPIRKDSLNFDKKNYDELALCAKEIIPQLAIDKIFDDYEWNDSTEYYTDHKKRLFSKQFFEGNNNQNEEFTFENAYKDNFENAYKRIMHPNWVIDQKNRLMTGLLSKLNSSVFILDKNGQRSGILDAEFAPRSGFSRLYSRSDNLFDHLIAHQSPELMGKVVSLLSPILAMRELQKPRLGNKSVMEWVIDHIPTANQPVVEVINKMRDLPERFFESAIAGFQFDVLGSIAAKCKNLAQWFYELAPGLMQRQYPKSSDRFTVEAPPPYEELTTYKSVSF